MSTKLLENTHSVQNTQTAHRWNRRRRMQNKYYTSIEILNEKEEKNQRLERTKNDLNKIRPQINGTLRKNRKNKGNLTEQIPKSFAACFLLFLIKFLLSTSFSFGLKQGSEIQKFTDNLKLMQKLCTYCVSSNSMLAEQPLLLAFIHSFIRLHLGNSRPSRGEWKREFIIYVRSAPNFLLLTP